MRASPAPNRELPVTTSKRIRASEGVGSFGCKTLEVARVGYLVPAGVCHGGVHSVFARACNIALDGGLPTTLVTIVAPALADGPTVVRLARGAPADLRLRFRAGDRFLWRPGVASTSRATLRVGGAPIWHPVPPPPAALRGQLEANLRFAKGVLERRRRACSSILDREASTLLDALGQACRRLDIARATAEVHRLVGWGEGLTPAGDDFIVGWLASLHTLAGGHSGRIRFLRSVCTAIIERTPRTTPISAHYLRLAGQGHFNADVTDLRNALLGERDGAVVAAALDAALDVGATSGADMVTGMIAGFAAWGALDGERGIVQASNRAKLDCTPG